MIVKRLPVWVWPGFVALLVAAGTATYLLAPAGRPATTPSALDAPVPPPRAHWDRGTLAQLLSAIDASAAEGLRPKDYQRDAIAAALKADRYDLDVDGLATVSARQLAHDYIDGRVTRRARFDWHIVHTPEQLATLDTDLANAVNGGRVTEYLDSLLPADPRYRALHRAYAASAADPARHDAIRASMERWRWMPRDLGATYVWVNVPTFRLQLFKGGNVVASHVVVVGAAKTPTPLLSADIGQIIVNPWWTLPPTVLREGKGRTYSPAKGYVYQTIRGRTYIRQKPGPMNALGRMKIDMPNAWAIYLHDTPAKSAFAQPMRALSHGCIRVQNIPALAEQLHDPAPIETALQTFTMKALPVKTAIPVYIAYFTAAPDAAGDVITYPDIYERDAALIAALDGVRYHPPAKPKPVLTKAESQAVTVNRAVDEPERAPQ